MDAHDLVMDAHDLVMDAHDLVMDALYSMIEFYGEKDGRKYEHFLSIYNDVKELRRRKHSLPLPDINEADKVQGQTEE